MIPKALGDKVIIHPIEAEAKIGSLFIPDPERHRVNNGIVIDIGKDVKIIKRGDHVLFPGYAGQKIALGDQGEFYILRETHIDCILIDSNVKLIDTETVKRLISERMGEYRAKLQKGADHNPSFDIEQALLDRIDTLTLAEGREF